MNKTSTFVPPNLRGHVPALDGVRGLAILMVLGVHFIGDARPDTAFERALTQVFSYGAMGVDLFFVLSGFLITGILYDSKSKPGYFRNFYMRRVLRIFPLYYGVLIVGLWVVPWFWNPPELQTSVENQFWLWTYCSNIFVSLKGDWQVLPFFNHFWSLAVEEHFYFIWPLLVFWTKGDRTRQIALLIAAGALGLRLFMLLNDFNAIAIYAFTPARLDALALGGFMALIAREEGGLERLHRWAPRALMIGGAFIVISFLATRVLPSARGWMHEFRQTAFSICFCAMLIFALMGPQLVQRFFKSGFMMYFGKYSYGLYVFHFMYGDWWIQHRTEDTVAKWVGSHTLAIFVQAGAGMLIAVVVSWLSYQGFEKHFLKLKTHFEPKSGHASDTESAAAIRKTA